MTVKQLAERLGVQIRDLDVELSGECKSCKKVGGTNEPTCEHCVINVVVRK